MISAEIQTKNSHSDSIKQLSKLFFSSAKSVFVELTELFGLVLGYTVYESFVGEELSYDFFFMYKSVSMRMYA